MPHDRDPQGAYRSPAERERCRRLTAELAALTHDRPERDRGVSPELDAFVVARLALAELEIDDDFAASA